MNKIVASLGIVALGASSIQAVYAQAMNTPPSKPWNVSASLRGFYDDNISSLPSGPGKKHSFGFEVTPHLGINWSDGQTTVMVGYDYSLLYYDTKPVNNTSHYDQDHTFILSLDHAINERFKVGAHDSFVIGQEPDMLRAGNTFNTFQRVSGNNIRNYGGIVLDGQITPMFGAELGYDNTYFDYHNTSLAGLLNQVDQSVHVEGNVQVLPETKAVVGYKYEQVEYTAGQAIGFLASGPIFSNSRDQRSHTGYVGLDHNFLPNLTGSARVGVSFTDYYNDPNGSTTKVSPYARASLRYKYAEQSYAEAGFSYNRNSADLVGVAANSYTLDEESAVLYASINHQLTPKIFGNVIGTYQNSTINGGINNNQSENYYLAGVNLQYRFNPNLSSEIGYNFDKLDSEVSNRSFDRNRVYIGITAGF
jgi:hypothetical protein